MEAAFSSIAFGEPARAESNLSVVEGRLPRGLWSMLPTLLAQVPEPDQALNYLERYLRELPAGMAERLEENPVALHSLLLLFSHSRFLSETLVQQPELILWLHPPRPVPYGTGPRRAGTRAKDRLDRIKSPEDLQEEFARFRATHFDQAAAVVLARFKRREYLRITLRDVLGAGTLAETTLELSHLADVLLECALRISEQKLENSYGRPQFTDAASRRHATRLVIFSLGKLGGQELNYSSDIDLMFLYGHDGETSGGASGSIANGEFFIRLAHAVLKLVTEATPEGAVFRVDLRLRPEGGHGDLALSFPAALRYYRERAREWELQALIKARPSAGDVRAGRRFLDDVQPLIYRPEFHFAAVEAVLNAREEITRQLERRSARAISRQDSRNVKLSPGGIRDIEFLAQCLQRLYGAADPWLAAPAANSTLLALQRLEDKGHLSARDFFRLSTAYQFFRQIEHRLQLRDGLQTHTLPDSPEALELLARRSGVEAAGGRSAGEQLVHRAEQHFCEVREIYERVLSRKLRGDEGPPADASEAGAGPRQTFLEGRLAADYPGIERAVIEAGWQSDPDARRGMRQFLSSALLDPALMARLGAHPEWIRAAGELFRRSDLVAEMLARHPEEIEVATGSEGGAAAAVATAPSGDGEGGLEPAMASLRADYRRAVLRTTVQALAGATPPFETFAAFTGLADDALARALDWITEDEFGRPPCGKEAPLAGSPLAVIALGRLGSSEMDIGSDADLIFIADARLRSDEREPWRRLVEHFVNITSSHTREGLLLPMDTRLRPRGAEGEIVQSAAYVREYFRSEAQPWEAATFLKARPLTANRELAAELIRDVQGILLERFGCERGIEELRRGLVHTRELLERQAVRPFGASIVAQDRPDPSTGSGSPRAEPRGEGSERRLRGKAGFKNESGGFYDIDYLVAFLFITKRLAPPGGHILRQIAALESAGALSPAEAQTLRSAAQLYRAVDHAVRLVTGRPAEQAPEPPVAGRVARLLADWQIPQAENLAGGIEEAREQVRALYNRIVAEPA
jgi:[glutamine synthetase] adenylyltransferase / [glutamine synthetase]-adenylyl-L-tyrosine phosphorylase